MPTQENEELEHNDDELEFDDDDYGFIIGSDGNLKHVMMPDELMDDPPLEVKKILKIFGIKSIHMVDHRTLH